MKGHNGYHVGIGGGRSWCFQDALRQYLSTCCSVTRHSPTVTLGSEMSAQGAFRLQGAQFNGDISAF